MKTWYSTKVIFLLGFIFLLSSCKWFYHDDIPEINTYMLALCFQDSSGKNVIEGIELDTSHADTPTKGTDEEQVHPNAYSLDVVFQSDISGEAGPGAAISLETSSLSTLKDDLLGTCFSTYLTRYKKNNHANKLTYKLRCPHVFGDGRFHELVTYWDLSEMNARCYRIEFEGQEIIPQVLKKNAYFSLGVVKLDK